MSESDDEYACRECSDNRGRQPTFDTPGALASHKAKKHRRSDETHIERYRRIRAEIPEKYRDAYEKITGQGKSPTAFQAAICYIESEQSQSAAADVFDVSEWTIRQTTRDIIREGVVSLEYVQENSPHSGSKVFNGKDGMCAGQEVRHGI